MIPRTVRDWMAVLWPSFLGAAIIELLVFAAFDPGSIQMLGWKVELSMQGAYTSAFFLFWAACTIVSLCTWNLLRTPSQVNRDSVDNKSLDVPAPTPGREADVGGPARSSSPSTDPWSDPGSGVSTPPSGSAATAAEADRPRTST